MIKAERQDKVRQLLEEQGTVSVKEISDALGVSDMTIRRDLEELASLGEIERVHGGARSAQGRPHAMLRHEYSHSEKRTKHAEESCRLRAVLWSLSRRARPSFGYGHYGGTDGLDAAGVSPAHCDQLAFGV